MGAPARERVGLLGGSFDPPHEGHLWLARRARSLWQLDAIWLLPAFQPPHKVQESLSPYSQRAAMAQLLAEGEPWLRVETIEAERGGPSYTLDTVRALKARDGARREFFLVLGEDSLAELDSWHEPAQLCAEIELLVVARAGWTPAGRWPHRLGEGETHPAQSRSIRAAIAAGQPAAWLTPAVAAYIERTGLYRRREESA